MLTPGKIKMPLKMNENIMLCGGRSDNQIHVTKFKAA